MDAKILDFVSHRKSNLEDKKRKFERIMFENLFGAYLVHESGDDVFKMNLIDVSYEGCLIEMPRIQNQKLSSFRPNDELVFRLYFSDKSFIPITIQVKRVIEKIEGGMAFTQLGCEFDQEVSSYEAIKSFIDFLHKFAQHSQIDKVQKRAFFW